MFKTTTFRQLKTLQTVARIGSISGAAQELHLTQPAVSLQIAHLGEVAQTPLLRKVGREIQLTEAGVILARYANEVLALWDDAADELLALKGKSGGTLRIGAITTAEYLIPPLLVTYTKKRPGVKLQFRIGNRDEIVRMLASNEIDLAVMGSQPRELRTNAAAFADHPMAFIAAPTHPLMGKPCVHLPEILEAKLLVRERGSGTRVTVESFFKEAGLKLHPASELSSNEAIKQLVEAGLGVAFLSLHACALELQNGLLSMLPVPSTPIVRTWYVVHGLDRRTPRVAMDFREFLIDSSSIRGTTEVP